MTSCPSRTERIGRRLLSWRSLRPLPSSLWFPPLKGVLFDCGEGRSNSVEAKPLRKGFVYEVEATSSGSGYGGGSFRIGGDGRVENLR